MAKFLVVFIFAISILLGEDIYSKGEKLYLSKGCPSCHGIGAKGLHEYPKLANRSKWDLRRRLYRLQKGIASSQQSSIMIPFAKTLSDDEIEAITYFLENIRSSNNEERYDMEYESWGDGGS